VSAAELAQLRAEIARLLGPSLRRVVESYNGFLQQTDEAAKDALSFGRHHNAAKSALGHMEALVKLGRWALADDGEEADLGAADVARLVGEARAALAEMDVARPAASAGPDGGEGTV
jgi:hypothetical protein